MFLVCDIFDQKQDDHLHVYFKDGTQQKRDVFTPAYDRHALTVVNKDLRILEVRRKLNAWSLSRL